MERNVAYAFGIRYRDTFDLGCMDIGHGSLLEALQLFLPA